MTTPDNGEPSRSYATYCELRRLIVEGKMTAGAPVSESRVAERLDVNRTPARRAIQRLRHEGYLEKSADAPRRSAPVVSALTRDGARDLLEAVGALEGIAAGRAAGLERGERKEIVGRLEGLNREIRSETESEEPDPAQLFDLDRSFHETFFRLDPESRIARIHSSLQPQTERYTRTYIYASAGNFRPSVKEHEEIIRTILEGESRNAQLAVHANWRGAATRLTDMIDMVGERGVWETDSGRA